VFSRLPGLVDAKIYEPTFFDIPAVLIHKDRIQTRNQNTARPRY
jgi:hypothetical protein